MYCECGCGQITTIANRTDNKIGVIKGQYRKFVKNHSLRVNWKKENDPVIDKFVVENTNTHTCQCGCGGYVKVQRFHLNRKIPKYIHGHQTTTPNFRAERVRYNKEHKGELSNRWVEDRSKVRPSRGQNFSSTQRREIYVRDEGICKSCGAFTLSNVGNQDPLKAHIDHIILVKDGGTNDLLNGQVLCLICHKMKHSAKAKTANSGKPKANAMVIPSQAPEMGACVETNVQSSKEMI